MSLDTYSQEEDFNQYVYITYNEHTTCVLTATGQSNDHLGGSGISECHSYPPGTQTPAAALWTCLSRTAGILPGRPDQTTSVLAKTTESVHRQTTAPCSMDSNSSQRDHRLHSLYLLTATSKHWILLQLQPFYGPLSGTTQVSRYQNKHSPTHLSWSSSNLYQLLPSTWSTASSLFNLRVWQTFCTTSFQVLFGLPVGLEPSTSYSIHFFIQSVCSFLNTD